MNFILSGIVFLPLVGAALILLTRPQDRNAQKYVALLTTGLTFALSCVLVAKFERGEAGLQFVERYDWVSSLKISYIMGVDGLSVSLFILTTLLFLLSVIASWNLGSGLKGYFSLFLALETTMLGTFAAQDLFLFFAFWAGALLPAYFMVSVWGGKAREYAATKFFLYQLAACAFLLLGMFAIYYAAEPHTFSLAELSGGKFSGATLDIGGQSLHFGHLIFVLMLIGFAVRIPVVPFHTWFPHVQSEAPPALAVILASAFLKTGAYALVRVNYTLFPEAASRLSPLLAAAGVVNIVYGGACALGQKDIRKLVAYSCVSHMGFVLLGLAIFSPMAFHGAFLVMICHGIYAGLLFFLVGILGARSGHYLIVNEDGTSGFGGLVKRAPLLTGFFTVAVFSALGVPGLGGFTPELLVFLGAFPAHRWLTLFALGGVLLTAGYFLWMYRRVFLGKGGEKGELVTDLTAREKVFLIPLVLLCVFVGSYPAPLMNLAGSTITSVLSAMGGTSK